MFTLAELQNGVKFILGGKVDPLVAAHCVRILELAYRLGRLDKAQEELNARIHRTAEANTGLRTLIGGDAALGGDPDTH